MEIIDDLAKAALRWETVLTIGAFDGVHLGHQELIKAMVAQARATDGLAALLTFHPHPAVVLNPERSPRYLTTPGEKMALLEALGLDLVVMLPFDRRLANTSARDFMEAVSHHLRLRELWIGADFALGRNREGDSSRLRELGEELGFQVHIVAPVTGASGVISSSRIRQLVAQGSVEEAARLLGRYPSLSGEVVTGAQRGQKMGFPTANLQVRPERATPADGVYAVFAWLGHECYPAVANIGVRPSFDNPLPQRTVETHIFGFDRDIYGCDLVVEFVARLRNERRFEHIGDLVAQIERDTQTARRILEGELRAKDSLRAELAAGSVLSTPCRFRYLEIEHTADRALRVWADELPNLFVGAAEGMYSLMADLDGLVATDWREVRLNSLDREALLVDWLNELLFLTEMEGLLFVEFRIERLGVRTEGSLGEHLAERLDGVSLVARAGSVAAPVTKAQIKAATFHNLEIVRDQDGWSAQITFDV